MTDNEKRAQRITDLFDTFDDDELTKAITGALDAAVKAERERCANIIEEQIRIRKAHKCQKITINPLHGVLKPIREGD